MNRKAMSMALTLVITIVVLIVIALALITVTTTNVAETGSSASDQATDSFCQICAKNICATGATSATVADCPCLPKAVVC